MFLNMDIMKNLHDFFLICTKISFSSIFPHSFGGIFILAHRDIHFISKETWNFQEHISLCMTFVHYVLIYFFVFTFSFNFQTIYSRGREEKEKQINRESSPLLVHSPDTHYNAWRACQGLNWEPGIQPMFLIWVTGTQLLYIPLLSSQGMHR